MRHWIDHTQYRSSCDDCGELHMVAVIQGTRQPRVRICERCYPLQNWKRSTWNDARWHRVRANRLSKQLGKALAERDRARDIAVELEQRAAYHEQVADSLGAAWGYGREAM